MKYYKILSDEFFTQHAQPSTSMIHHYCTQCCIQEHEMSNPILSYDVAVFKWITSCDKNPYDHMLHNILVHTCNVITTSVTTLHILLK